MSLLQCVSPIHMVLMICTHMYISHLYLCLSHIYVCIYVSALHMVLMILRLYSTPSRTQGAGRRSHQGIGHGARGFKAAKPAAVNGVLRAVWVNMGHRIEAEIRRHLQQARPPEPCTIYIYMYVDICIYIRLARLSPTPQTLSEPPHLNYT